MSAPINEVPTSFQKKKRVSVQIPGTKPSFHNAQLLISTGVPSLDHVIGGGLAVGTILLIEDLYGNYAKVLLKYFLAEGCVVGHELLVASCDVPPKQIMAELPGPIMTEPVDSSATDTAESMSKMNIAWRYQNLPVVKSSTTSKSFSHYYDLTKVMPEDLLNKTTATLINTNDFLTTPCTSSVMTLTPAYENLLRRIQSQITDGGFGTTQTKPQSERNVLRIALHALGSPLWRSEDWSSDRLDTSLTTFLYLLRALMRQSYAACLITVPTHLFEDAALTRRVERLADTAIRLESFCGSQHEHNPAFKEYHGLFHIVRLPRLNCLTCQMPETLDLAFKLRRKTFMIEKLHLPPDLSETASRSQEELGVPLSSSSAHGCNAAVSRNLDF
ncbi:PREDICTED: elongator complex protein 4-like isoform X2 [Priapulus caudatus]|uniref:Elongator complex protein 4 n=1 Tax=Priapulus caudatus TaxID=37621 RepID=A0ABM1EU47_PRICU|nr:PREDICTED: elongator complex protein 4-like isoform X2 [Priapulus caudatus]